MKIEKSQKSLYCLAGSFKTTPRIVDYSFELNSIETYAPQFFGHNILFLGRVICVEGLSDHYVYCKLLLWVTFSIKGEKSTIGSSVV